MALHPKFWIVVAAWFAATFLVPSSAEARGKRAHRARPVTRIAPPSDDARGTPPLDDFYRRRGYGIGGPIFGGDTALAGNCADLRFAEPASCGRGYGIYGNGLGARFGH